MNKTSYIENKLNEYLELSEEEISIAIKGVDLQNEAIKEIMPDEFMGNAALILRLIYSVALSHKTTTEQIRQEALGFLEISIKNILEKK